MLATYSKISVLDDIGDQFAPVGSLPWSKWFVGQAKLSRHEIQSDAVGLQKLLAKLKKHEAWKALGFASFSFLCRQELDLDDVEVDAIIQAKRGVSLESVIRTAKNAKPIGEHGGARNGKQGSDRTLKRGETADYLSARIARDRPDIIERMKAGEFKSVRQAAIEAGIVKVKSDLEKLCSLWSKLPERDRKKFLDWIAVNDPVEA